MFNDISLSDWIMLSNYHPRIKIETHWINVFLEIILLIFFGSDAIHSCPQRNQIFCTPIELI